MCKAIRKRQDYCLTACRFNTKTILKFLKPHQTYKYKLFGCLIWLLILYAISPLKSQTEDFIFKNYTERDGLCDNIVFSLLKDKNNILWVGTQNGLARFDGNNFYNFKQKKQGNSIPNNTVNSLCEDPQGNIWGGTEDGLFCFDASTQLFKTYNTPGSCFNNLITNVICDQKGEVYATTYLELLHFDAQNNKLVVIAKLAKDFSNPDVFNTGKNCLLKDENSNTLWVASRGGMFCYDLNNKQLYSPHDQAKNPLFVNRLCRALSPFKNGQLLFADNKTKEIIIFEPSTKKIINSISLATFQPDAYVGTILLDKQDKLWISCFNQNLITIDLKHNYHFDRVVHKNDRNYTVSSEYFWDALTDDNGSVWLGTLNGLSVCSPSISVFKAMQLPELIPGLSSHIHLINEDPKTHKLWLVTNDKAVIHYDAKTHQHLSYKISNFVPNSFNEIPDVIEFIFFLNDQPILTSYAGAWVLSANRKRWEPLRLLPPPYDKFRIKNIVRLDSLFYVSDGSDILQYNTITRQCQVIYNRKTQGPEDDTSMEIVDMYVDSHKNLYWVCYRNYIGSYQNNKVNFIQLNKRAISKNVGYFCASAMDKQDRIWVGFKGVGFYSYDTNTGEVKWWTEFDGWINNHVHKIINDREGNIWTMYYNKVSCFNPLKESFINFSIPYSESRLGYANAMIQSHDGSILGVVGNDVFQLKAQDLGQLPILNSPGFTSVTIADKVHFFTSDTTLYLESDENSIVFKYGLLIDPAAYPHYFEYRLTGFDKTWKKTELVYQSGYSHLPPGKYTFEVVAKGRNYDWASKPNKISFVIKTPFYKTTLFYIVVVSAIIVLLILIYKYRIAQFNKVMGLESKAQLLEKEKAQVMYDGLKQQLNPHFLFNSLTSLSALIETDQEMASRFLSQMSDMYRYILKNANEETVALKDELTFVETYIGLQKTRFGKGLMVNINVPEPFGTKKIAPVTLQNMLENAIKHNVIDRDSPLIIDIYIEEPYLVVKNNLQAKTNVENSNKRGLLQFLSLYRYLSPIAVEIDQTENHFIIKIPLI